MKIDFKDSEMGDIWELSIKSVALCILCKEKLRNDPSFHWKDCIHCEERKASWSNHTLPIGTGKIIFKKQ